MRQLTNNYFYLIVTSTIIGLLGCKSSSTDVPAYLDIDSVSVVSHSGQGNNIHQITAVQIYANAEYLGLFELPCKVPVLKSGAIKIECYPYVKLNGKNNQWAPYRILKTSDTILNFNPQKHSSYNPTFKFRTETYFRLEEDFSDGNSKLIPIPKLTLGDTMGVEERPFDLSDRFKSANNKVFVAKFENTDTAKYMDIATFDSYFGIPVDGRSIQLEYDINCDLPVQLSLVRTINGVPELLPFLYMNATGKKWKRFYVDISPEIAGFDPGLSIQLVFSINKPSGFINNREILIDNLRLSYLN